MVKHSLWKGYKVTPVPAEMACHDLFAEGGEMGSLMGSFDWTATPLGRPETWNPTLRTMTRMLLRNSFPILLWWGPEFIQLYNDAYIPVLGDKHPHRALGKPFRECWAEVYPVLGPLAETPFRGGPPTWIEDIPVELNRYAYKEEAHFTISYSPVPDAEAEGGIGGVVAIVHEISAKIVSDRRISALRDLASRAGKAQSAEEACAGAAATLGNYAKDVPFAGIYLLDEERGRAGLAGHTGGDVLTLFPKGVDRHDSAWPFWECQKRAEMVVVRDLGSRFGRVPAGPWADPPNMAAVVPIQSQLAHQPAGFLVAGISSRLQFDDDYRGFLELVSAQIGTSIANAHAYEMERRRNEALAELDRAKTTFYSNISHELRTPLTLITGPVEDLLAKSSGMGNADREQLELAHRNSLRMLKLVNALLDFSRIQGGSVRPYFEPIDLSAFTAELASAFRSTIERAGLRLVVDCPPLSRPVYVDREMWEKIVFNLLSNAFKFTFEGEITVAVREAGDSVTVSVSDTGTGIPADELANVFARFHTVRGSKGRSYEGSGIGLALAQELARLHGGAIELESEVDKGSRFTVRIPFGKARLGAERLKETRAAADVVRSEAFLQEMDRWLANEPAPELKLLAVAAPDKDSEGDERPVVLIADDNADMRIYLSRLLESAYRTIQVSNGVQAIEAIERHHPDLVISDVMMPEVDGIGILRAVRGRPELHHTPVILLSARAGEEARVEGLQAGADDYIVKPFPARELLARVESHLALLRLRRAAEDDVRESETRFRALVAASSEVVYRMNPDWTVMDDLQGRQFPADTNAPKRSWLERYILAEDRADVTAAIQEAIRAKSIFQLEHRVLRADGSLGWTFSRAVPLLDARGEIKEWFGAATDITGRKRAEAALLQSERLASLGRMAATISHEINNPLAALTNLIFLAETTAGVPEPVHALLKTAEAELGRVAHITRQSLGFYREAVSPVAVRIETVVESALEMLQGKIRRQRAHVERQWHCEREVHVVVGEFRQVFTNLISNSLDALGDNGTITIRTSLYKGRKGEERLRISVGDNGRGIERLARAQIFEPLYTTKDTLGTGLGLWVTRQIIDKHEGAIQVRSSTAEAHRGSVFSITLPLTGKARQAAHLN